MIYRDMKEYNYFTFGVDDEYGEPKMSTTPAGKVKMSIYLTSKNVQDNINFEDANYIGFTHNANIDSSYVIEYGNEKLKVLYVNPMGRFNQIFMMRM